MKLIQQQLTINEQTSGLRLDQALCAFLPEYSRSKIQDWIKQGFIQLNETIPKPKVKVYVGDVLQLDIPPTTKTYDKPEQVEFDIVFQDEHLFVVNKPAGLVVHPAAGHASGTLLNGLLYIDPALEQLPRAGIVHRLDKDTTGVMVVALETGRTHQIRVHLAHLRYPLLGDPVYGGRLAIPKGVSAELEQLIRNFKRQALHAFRLSFAHPISAEPLSFEAGLPEDMTQLIDALRQDAK